MSDGIVAEENKLNFELSLQEAERVSDVAMRDTMRDVVKLSELLKIFIHTTKRQSARKEEIIREIFSAYMGNAYLPMQKDLNLFQSDYPHWN